MTLDRSPRIGLQGMMAIPMNRESRNLFALVRGQRPCNNGERNTARTGRPGKGAFRCGKSAVIDLRPAERTSFGIIERDAGRTS